MIHDKIEIIKSYRKAYKNYFRVLLTLYIKQKNSYRENNIKVMLKNGKNMVLPYGFITSYARFIQYKKSEH